MQFSIEDGRNSFLMSNSKLLTAIDFVSLLTAVFQHNLEFQWQSHGYHWKSFKILSAFKNLSQSKILFCHLVEKVSHVSLKIRIKTMSTVLVKGRGEQWRNDLAKMSTKHYTLFLNLLTIISQRRFYIRNHLIGISETTNCNFVVVLNNGPSTNFDIHSREISIDESYKWVTDISWYVSYVIIWWKSYIIKYCEKPLPRSPSIYFCALDHIIYYIIHNDLIGPRLTLFNLEFK